MVLQTLPFSPADFETYAKPDRPRSSASHAYCQERGLRLIPSSPPMAPARHHVPRPITEAKAKTDRQQQNYIYHAVLIRGRADGRLGDSTMLFLPRRSGRIFRRSKARPRRPDRLPIGRMSDTDAGGADGTAISGHRNGLGALDGRGLFVRDDVVGIRLRRGGVQALVRSAGTCRRAGGRCATGGSPRARAGPPAAAGSLRKHRRRHGEGESCQ
jgi:hypothetical protein